MKHIIFEKELKHNIKKFVSVELGEVQCLDGKFYYYIEQIQKTIIDNEIIRAKVNKDMYRSKCYDKTIVLYVFEDLCAKYLNLKYKQTKIF